MRSVTHVVVLAAAVASPLFAQAKPQTRDGFTIGFGLGLGSAGISCNGCTTDRQNSGSYYLRIGGAVRPNLIIAGETQGWVKSVSDQGTTEDITIVSVLAVAVWYPEPKGGFYVLGGLGLGGITDDIRSGVFSANVESTGLAFNFGGGYDFRLGKNFSLSPYVSYLATAGAEAKVNGTSTGEKLNANLFQVGLGFTWH